MDLGKIFMGKNKMFKQFKLGTIVFIALMIVEIIEYVVGVKIVKGNLILLTVLAILGAWLILQYFMHIQHLWIPHDKTSSTKEKS